MKFNINHLPWIICLLLLAVIGYLTYRVIVTQPIVINDWKYEYLLKQHEALQISYAAALQDAQRWQQIADEKPKEIIKIKKIYVEKIDSIIRLDVTDKERIFAIRLHH